MTEDISNYTFDFEKEADALRRSLGFRGSNILFVDVSVSDSGEADLRQVVGDEGVKEKNLSEVANEIFAAYRYKPGYSSYQKTFDYRFPRGYAYVSLREDEPFSKTFGEKNESLMRLFTLYHETGHALTHDFPAVNADHASWECAADAYAALRFFQRFGREAGPLLSMISWVRAIEAVVNDTSHLTTTVLDKIIADSASMDFSKLTSGETVRLAEKYAREWAPEDSVLMAARPLLTQGANINFALLATTCLSSPDNFSFYIGAKLFQPLLQPEGVVLNGQQIQLQEEDRRGYTELIEKRAAGMKASEIFNAAVKPKWYSGFFPKQEPPLAELLKVTRPKGQKQFVFNM